MIKVKLGYRMEYDDWDLVAMQPAENENPRKSATIAWHNIGLGGPYTKLFSAGENLSYEFLQACLDEAWTQGLRPKGFSDHTAELGAVRYHLEDMRTLAKVKK